MRHIVVFYILLSLHLPEAKGQNFFTIEIDRIISSQDMDCNYQNEDYAKRFSNFDFPKLLLIKDQPIVAFIDEKSEQIIFVEISDALDKIVCRAPGFKNAKARWPDVFERMGNICLCSYDYVNAQEQLSFFQIDLENGRLRSQESIFFMINGGCYVWGSYPYIGNTCLIGKCSIVCPKKLPTMFLGGDPTYFQKFSYIMDKEQKLIKQPIGRGCNEDVVQEYEVNNDKNVIHVAWVEMEGGFGIEFLIKYSSNFENRGWVDPIKLNTISYPGIMDIDKPDISLACEKDTAFVLWKDLKKGIFLSEINRDRKIETIKIGSSKKKSLSYDEPMTKASIIKVASDHRGNAYLLWAENLNGHYSLFFKARLNGKWTDEMVVNEGPGYLKLPDMKVDEKGKVHIVFIKSIDPDEPNGRYGCFYMSLSKTEAMVSHLECGRAGRVIQRVGSPSRKAGQPPGSESLEAVW